MKIGNYEIPMIGTIMPWALLIFVVCVIKIFAGRMWNDKEITLKKVALLTASIGLIFVSVLYIGDVVTWVWAIVGKMTEIVKNVKVS